MVKQLDMFGGEIDIDQIPVPKELEGRRTSGKDRIIRQRS